MKTIFTAIVFSATLNTALAVDTCANMAKNGAIRAYMSEMGTVQGSEGIQYSAHLVHQTGNSYKYEVVISDNNEDGETWDVNYLVQVQLRGTSCKIVKVSQEIQ